MNCIINQGYDPYRILGVFLYGSQNYGFMDARNNINSIIVIIPTFEDVCLNTPPVSKEYSYGTKKERIQVKDIRLYRQMLVKQDVNFIETLFTPYFILNPDYQDLFQQCLVNNNETIAHLDMRQAAVGMGEQIMSLLNGSPLDSRALYEANRLYFCLRNYLLDKPFLECIQPTENEKQFLTQIKQKQSNIVRDPEALNENVENLKFQVQDLLNDSIALGFADHSDAQSALDRGIIGIMRSTFGQLDVQESGLTADQFLNSLTDTERTVYNIIAFETHGQGFVIISHMMKQYGFSRNTYNRVLNKIKEEGIGITKNQGAKGLYVEIIHPELLEAAKASTGVEY